MSAPMSFDDWLDTPSGRRGCRPLQFFEGGQESRQPEIDALKAELERECMCHAGCGVVAMANTDDALAKAMDMSPEYLSAAIRDVARAVRAEIDLRKENEALKARIAELEDKLVNAARAAGAEAGEADRQADAFAADMQAKDRLIPELEQDAARWQSINSHWSSCNVKFNKSTQHVTRIDLVIDYTKPSVFAAGRLADAFDRAMKGQS